MQRFLDPEGLKSRGIEHFDAWAATFGEVVDTMEISPDGKTLEAPQPLRQVHQPARAAADVPRLRRRADGRDARPAAAAAGRRQAARRRLPDVGGAARRSSRNWSPATSGCGRRRSIPARTTPWPSPPTAASSPSTPGCSRPTAADFPGSKINALVENVAAIWQRTAATRGTQMIFCDMGVNPTPWGYSRLRRDHREAGRRAASPASRSPPSATPTPTPRSRPCSSRSAAARCAC